jgi:hypothetical protein
VNLSTPYTQAVRATAGALAEAGGVGANPVDRLFADRYVFGHTEHGVLRMPDCAAKRVQVPTAQAQVVEDPKVVPFPVPEPQSGATTSPTPEPAPVDGHSAVGHCRACGNRTGCDTGIIAGRFRMGQFARSSSSFSAISDEHPYRLPEDGRLGQAQRIHESLIHRACAWTT